jgi:cytochrome c-type biogenesis protein CcmH/NrfG
MRNVLTGLAGIAVLMMLCGNAYAVDVQDVHRIYFTIDQAELLPVSQLVLHGVAEMLRANPEQHLYLVGHTCDLESHAYNDQLARQRADRAMAYLVNEEGIARERLIESSFGEEQPRYENVDEQARALNRRVVLTMDVLAAPASVPAPAPTVAYLLMTGNSAFANGDYAGAVVRYLQAVTLEPGNTSCLNNLGAAYFQLGDYANAGYYYDTLLRHTPTSAPAYLYLGICRNYQGYRDQAIQCWEYCLQLEPKNVTARQLLERYRQ